MKHVLLRKHWTLQHILHNVTLYTDVAERTLKRVQLEDAHGTTVTDDTSTSSRSFLETMQDDEEVAEPKLVRNYQFNDETMDADIDLEARLLTAD